MQEIAGGILAPRGFKAVTVSCGIKAPKGQRKDLLLVYSERPAAAAGVFTTNRVKAAPVLLCQRHLRRGIAQAIVVNSGNANACNGETGMRDAQTMAELAAAGLGIPTGRVLVASTGVIGRPMPMDRVRDGISEAIGRMDDGGGQDAARAIMTTDTRPKEVSVRFEIDGATVSIGGIAKGAGMICPTMATMISVLTTDAAIAAGPLRAALHAAVEASFNRITVDGDMSTNDTVIIVASGQAGNKKITSTRSAGYRPFLNALRHACTALAKMIARDGEGATKFIEIQVRGAKTDRQAKTIGRSIGNSLLVKTAIYGKDPNWGRIVCAAGYAQADVDPDRIDLFLCGHQLVANGQGLPLDEAGMRNALEGTEIPIVIDLKLGNGSATVWTCDLSHEYVTVNAEYTT